MGSTYLSLHFHLVFSTKNREPTIRDAWRSRLHDYLGGTIRGLGGFPEGVGGTADHVHLLVGCGFEDAPAGVALCFLNNLAFAHGMEAVFQFGGFVGTVGEYDFGALRDQSSPDPDKQDRGGGLHEAI